MHFLYMENMGKREKKKVTMPKDNNIFLFAKKGLFLMFRCTQRSEFFSGIHNRIQRRRDSMQQVPDTMIQRLEDGLIQIMLFRVWVAMY